jgi:hypothetical protein
MDHIGPEQVSHARANRVRFEEAQFGALLDSVA